jgi:hypothetical protein
MGGMYGGDEKCKTNFIGNTEGITPLISLRCRVRDNIKIDFKETGW